jgi:ABC-type polysaccharide/polyol phosphate export permease
MVSARYRDIPPLIANVLQVLLFVTPIFWSPSQLGEQGRLFVIFNYVYHLVDVLRSPLLGRVPLGLSYLVVLAGGILGWAFTFAVYARFRRRIAFWL